MTGTEEGREDERKWRRGWAKQKAKWSNVEENGNKRDVGGKEEKRHV